MSHTRSYDLARRLTWTLWTCAAVVFAIVAAVLLWRAHAVNEQALEFALADRALSLASLLEVDSRELELEADPSTLPDYRGPHAEAFFAIVDAETRTLLASSEAARGWLPDAPDPLVTEVLSHLTPGDPHARWRLDREGRAVELLARRFVVQPEAEDDDPELVDLFEQALDPPPTELPADREIVVLVGLDRARHDATYTATVWLTVPTLCAGLLVLAGLVLVTVRRGVRPLATLAGQVRAMGPERLEPVTVPRAREVGDVAVAINTMVGELDEALVRERRFMADVAHELRTPVAELQTLSEVALRVGEADRDDLEEVAAVARRMSATIGALSTLARADAGHLVTAKATSTDLVARVRDAWRAHADRAFRNQLEVALALPDTLRIETDPAALASVVGNLIENAVSYTPPGGRVAIELGGAGESGFELRVHNEPVALTQDQLEAMFERFWRRDEARADEHSGLGLALARELAQALGLELSAGLDAQRLTMTLRTASS